MMSQAEQSEANALARGGVQAEQYLTFLLGGEVYAMGILSIKEILEYQPVTTVPMTPGYVRGVINLRGAVVPVLDLSVRFGKPSSPLTKRTCIVIVEIDADGERFDIGVLVDTVNAVLDILPTDIEQPPAFGAHIDTDFIRGMGKVQGEFVILLDVGRILPGEAMLALADTGAPALAAAHCAV